MICICVKNISIAGPLRLMEPSQGPGRQRIEAGETEILFDLALRPQPLVDVPHPQLDLRILPEGIRAWHRAHARGARCYADRLRGVGARLGDTGVLKLFYLYDLPDDFVNAAPQVFADFGTTIIQDTETEGPIYRALFDHVARSGWVVARSGLSYDHWTPRAGEGRGKAFDDNAVLGAWHSVHFVDTGAVCAARSLLPEDAVAAGVANSHATDRAFDIRFVRFRGARGRFGWQVTGAGIEDADLIDIVDVGTLAMDIRQVLDATRENAIRMAADLPVFVAGLKSRSLSSAISYEVQAEQRVLAAERLGQMIEPVFREVQAGLMRYYDIDATKARTRKAFDVLRQAVAAEREARNDRFSKTVTIVALVFTALSFVTTGIALVDYFDPANQMPRQSRILFLVLSLLPGILGLGIALAATRRTQ